MPLPLTHTYTYIKYNLIVFHIRRRLLWKISLRLAFAFVAIRILFNFSETKRTKYTNCVWTLHLCWRRRRRQSIEWI